MSNLLLPRRFYNQPQGSVSINSGSPLLGTTANVILPPAGAYDAASGQLYTVSSGVSVGVGGGGVMYSGKSSASVTLPSIVDRSVPVTFAFLAQGMFELRGHQNSNSGLVWSSGFKVRAQFWDTTLPGPRTILSGSVSATQMYRVVITISIANLVSLYVDEALIGTVTVGNLSSDNNPRFGCVFQDGSTTGSLLLGIKTNLCWTHDQVREWGANPYQIFKVSE
jgi:hypothetical protein